jgi:hypothetical protein
MSITKKSIKYRYSFNNKIGLKLKIDEKIDY